ncbi:26S proteasome non-ATPase regulatory subunit 12-like [Talpa occidentalis]|uniref:26S proteasome non-ATPase regulatory subunit 12-like n=1 Tax=Talpa occidentalis TaxID=50954 RepID=UPI001890A3BA|nr:26S proteasome non-ATPase regulatory subunit 12-like [Talpa occidentalis]
MADGGSERADGRIVKMEVDYSATVDQRLPECEKLAKEGRLQEVIETLLSLEKQTRTASDMVSTSRILVAVVKMCYEAKEWDLLNENIMLLSKRRSQLKQVSCCKMVQQCCTYVEEITDLPIKLRLIDTLRMVTEGKIYVEIERARLTKTLATIKEQNGDVKEAASILQELQVETYGSMEKKERVEFILEQMRLCLAVKDYIRTQIISKKINTKFFQEENTEKLKLKYYNLMIQLDQHEGSYLSICKHYRAIYDTPCIQAESEKWQQALKSVVLYVILAPFDNEQSDLVHRISGDKKLEEIPKYKDLLKLFTTMELMRWSTLVEDYGMELRKGSLESPATDVFGYTEEGEKRWKDLKNRVVEHVRIWHENNDSLEVNFEQKLFYFSEAGLTPPLLIGLDRVRSGSPAGERGSAADLAVGGGGE